MTTGGVTEPSGDAAPPGIFPDDYGPGDERTTTIWDLSGPLPIPRHALSCWACGGVLVVKDWKLHQRKNVGSTRPWRCDVRLKCMTCGLVPTFGVLVSEQMYRAGVSAFGRGCIHWRVGRKAMEEG